MFWTIVLWPLADQKAAKWGEGFWGKSSKSYMRFDKLWLWNFQLWMIVCYSYVTRHQLLLNTGVQEFCNHIWKSILWRPLECRKDSRSHVLYRHETVSQDVIYQIFYHVPSFFHSFLSPKAKIRCLLAWALASFLTAPYSINPLGSFIAIPLNFIKSWHILCLKKHWALVQGSWGKNICLFYIVFTKLFLKLSFTRIKKKLSCVLAEYA